MVHSFVFTLDTPAMINISYKTIKIMHKKILNTIIFDWYKNDTLAKNNSLNSHSK